MVKRFEVYLFNLDKTSPDDAKNTRPCIVVSPNEMNKYIDSIIIAPISAAGNKYPTRVQFEFLGEKRAVILDQIRTVEKERLVKKIGEVKGKTKGNILSVLQELFAE